MTKERSSNKQLAINIISNIAIYVLQFGVSFFLTPYIVKTLGVEANGFVQLSTQIISYTTLISVGLNAMAARFITVEYHKGDLTQANKFFSSVFWGNVFLGSISLIASLGILVYLDQIVNIPDYLSLDVKILFGFLSVNAVLSIVGSVFNIATFVKNRLELRSIRSAIGSIINVSLLLVIFASYAPRLCFLGITGFVGTIYVLVVNMRLTKTLTPELHIDIRFFDWSSIKMLLQAGMWSLIVVLSGLFAQGLDLLLTNVFIGATAMGILSLSKSVPIIIQSIATSLSTCFVPSWTQHYAKNERNQLRADITKSISIMGLMSGIPLSLYVGFGNEFYALWLPGQDYGMIFALSVVGLWGSFLSMPLDAIWETFTVENKIKQASIAQIVSNAIVFVVIVLGVMLVEDPGVKIFIVAGARSLMIAVRAVTFLACTTAAIIGIKVIEFYKPLFRTCIASVIIIVASYFLKLFFVPDTWSDLIIAASMVGILGVISSGYIILDKSQRQFLLNIVKSRISYI